MFRCKFHKSGQRLNRHELVRTLAPDAKSRTCAADGKCRIICNEGVLIGGNKSTVMLHVHCLLSPSFVFCAPMGQVFYRNSIVRWNARVTNACSDANFINQDSGATDTS